MKSQFQDFSELAQLTRSISQNKSLPKKNPPIKYKPKDNVVDSQLVSDWFLEHPLETINSDFYGYFPWIYGHTESLVDLIRTECSDEIRIIPFFKDNYNEEMMRKAAVFSKENPSYLRMLVLSRLTKIRPHLKGIIFTFDWNPFFHIISNCCKTLGIPRILIPHEGVFANRDKYYLCTFSGIDRPNADIALCWGNLQKDIWIERGYPENRIHVCGSPKLDVKHNHNSQINKQQFSNIYGLDESLPTFLFVAQPLDCQFDQKAALQKQRTVISNLVGLSTKYQNTPNAFQVLFRMPLPKVDTIPVHLEKRIENSKYTKIDKSGFYRLSSTESIINSCAVISINSTMLLEAQLLNRAAISTCYFEFDSMWEEISVSKVHDKEELEKVVLKVISGEQSTINIDWAKSNLSHGDFDGESARRIVTQMSSFADKENNDSYDADREFLLNKNIGAGNIAFHNPDSLNKTQKYLPQLLGCDHIGMPENPTEALSYNHYVRWGINDTPRKTSLDQIFNSIGRKAIYVEDSFIRSPGLGVSGDSTLGVILDDLTPYYNSRISSRLETLLNSDITVSKDKIIRCQAIMEKIKEYKVTKYNHVPHESLLRLREGRKAVLLLDQRRGDASIYWGQSDSNTFHRMFHLAKKLELDHDVFIKIHPDAITGGKRSCFDFLEESFFLEDHPNIKLLHQDINPHSLFEIVDEVWTATSGMGFEALIAGKKVKCFGVPFYSGWGLTDDLIETERRVKKRSLEEVFYISYILLSRYYNPETERLCELEELIDYLVPRCVGTGNVESSGASSHN